MTETATCTIAEGFQIRAGHTENKTVIDVFIGYPGTILATGATELVTYTQLEASLSSLDLVPLHLIYSELSIKSRFDQLVAEWKQDTRITSNTRFLVEHSAHQEIIRMGEDALPLILQDLKAAPWFWFYALGEITGLGPAPEGDMPNTAEELRQSWINWGIQNGHLG